MKQTEEDQQRPGKKKKEVTTTSTQIQECHLRLHRILRLRRVAAGIFGPHDRCPASIQVNHHVTCMLTFGWHSYPELEKL